MSGRAGLRVLLLALAAAGLALVAVFAGGAGQASPSSRSCGSVDAGAGVRLAVTVAGAEVKSTVGGRLVGGARGSCSLDTTIATPAAGYSATVTLIGARSVRLAYRMLSHLRSGPTHFLLALDERTRGQLRPGASLKATLWLGVTSPQGKISSANRRLVLRFKTATFQFSWTGAEQTFEVPVGVHSVYVTAVGAAGGLNVQPDYTEPGAAPGGKGAIVSGSLSVHPGEVLYVEVGANSNPGTPDDYYGGGAGDSVHPSQGGGFSGHSCYRGCAPGGGNSLGGGGASDVRTISSSAPESLESRLVVAGGGGGGGGTNTGPPGGRADGAGGDAGQPGQSQPGGGAGGSAGTSSGGGAGGAGSGDGSPGASGAPSDGGRGGDGDQSYCLLCNGYLYGGGGGGGGGGLYGGGGGGGGARSNSYQTPSAPGGGGGGGSSLIPANGSFAIAPVIEAPSVTITYTLPS